MGYTKFKEFIGETGCSATKVQLLMFLIRVIEIFH
jgi:hypothetical protein